MSPKCPFCAEAVDAFGNYLLCCHKAECYTRHQVNAKCMTTFVEAAGITAANEMQIEGSKRPAGIFLDRWTTANPVAIDVCHAPVGASPGLNLRKAKEVTATKERQKIVKYAHLIKEKRVHFIPAAFTTLGALGPHASQFVDNAAVLYIYTYSANCAVDCGLRKK